MIKTSNKEVEKFAREGWGVFLNSDTNKLEVQKYDDPKRVREGAGYDFKIPELESDDEAVTLAKKYFVIGGNGYEILSRVS